MRRQCVRRSTMNRFTRATNISLLYEDSDLMWTVTLEPVVLNGKRLIGFRASVGAIARDVYPLAIHHHAIHGADGRDIVDHVASQHEQIRAHPWAKRAELIALVKKAGGRSGRRCDCLDGGQTALDEELQLAPRRFAAGGKRHRRMAAHHEARSLE